MPSTVDWIDVTWTILSLIGLVLWAANLRGSVKSLLAARRLMVGDGPRLWARFGVNLTGTMTCVELVFVAVGVNAMTRRAPTASQAEVTRWVAVVLFLAVTTLLAVLAYRWGEVDRAIIRMAQRTPPIEKGRD